VASARPAPDDGAVFAGAARTHRPVPSRSSAVRAIVVCLLGYAIAGAVGGVVWDRVTTLAAYRVTKSGAYIDEPGLSLVFSSDGWFLVVGLGLGLVGGAALGLAYRRHGFVMVLAVLAGSCLAGYVAYRLGHQLGPTDLRERLRAAKPGQLVPIALSVRSTGCLLGWPIGGLLGALGAALSWKRSDPQAAVPVVASRRATATTSPGKATVG
jgi:hypothetical protein